MVSQSQGRVYQQSVWWGLISWSGVGIPAKTTRYSVEQSALTQVFLPDLMPPILSGILAIYGLVISVIISTALKEKSALHTNFLQLAAGLTVGLSALAAGFCIGIVGDAGVRGVGQQPRLYVGMMLMLIFAEVLGKCGFLHARGILSRWNWSLLRDLWLNCRTPAYHRLPSRCYRVFIMAS